MKHFLTLILFINLICTLSLIHGQWHITRIDSNIDGTILDVGDIDADNDLDVVVTAGPEGRVFWYENNGDNLNWSKRTIDAGLSYPIAVFIADINGDSLQDVVSGGFFSDNVVWYENLGDSPVNWGKKTIDTNLDGASNVCVADIDGDSLPDIVASGQEADDIVWYENLGGATISWKKEIIDPNLQGALFVWIADMDGDSDLDVVATGQDTDVVVWYENDGLTPPGWSKHTIDDSLDGASIIMPGDIDADGMMDVAATSTDANVIVWYKNNLPDTNWTKYFIDDNKPGALGVELADLDGDMDLDVIAAGYESSTTWYENNLPDPIWPKYSIYSPFDGRPSGIADMDNDNDPDVVLVGKNEGIVGWCRNDIWTAIEPPFGGLPTDYTLSQNYPNPFNPATTIRYSLLNASKVKIEVFNLLGSKVTTLVNTKKPAGSHSINFNGSNLSSSVYLYRIQADDFIDVKKMVLMK